MRTLVAIPVYNEERYLPRVLRAVREHARDVLVIDDGSTDGTARVLAGLNGALRGVRTLTHERNLGYGRALIDAFRYADAHRFDWIITLDCDEQHEPAQIPEFVALARRGVADVVSGSRYLVDHPDDDPPPADRRRLNRIVTSLLEPLLGLRLTDSFCGFKAHRVAAIRRLRLDEAGYAFPLQFWVQCMRAGLTVLETPVRRIYRDASRSFGGELDDSARRLRHYLEVLFRELNRTADDRSGAASRCTSCGVGR